MEVEPLLARASACGGPARTTPRAVRAWPYVKQGVDELEQEKLSPLLKLKYHNAISDAVAG